MNFKELSDNELVIRIATGCESSFNEIYERHHVNIRTTLYPIMKNRIEDMEEVFNNVLLKIWTKAKTFKGDSKFSTWLYTVSSNEAYMHLRDKRTKKNSNVVYLIDFGHEVHTLLHEEYLAKRDYAMKELERKELLMRLNRAISRLKPFYLATFVPIVVDGEPTELVDKKLGISLASRKARNIRARAILKQLLNDEGNQLKERLVNYRRAA